MKNTKGTFPNPATQFSSTNQPEKNGRKKRIYTILKEKGFGADDIKTAFKEMAFYSIPELKEIYKDETKPVITRIIANQFAIALTKGDYGRIREIMEHTIGKPLQEIKQETELKTNMDPFKEMRKALGIDKTDESNDTDE